MFIRLNNAPEKYDIRNINYNHIMNGEIGNELNCMLDETAVDLKDSLTGLKNLVGVTIERIEVIGSNDEVMYDITDPFKIDSLNDSMNEDGDRRDIALRLLRQQ